MFGQKRSGLETLLQRPRPSAWELFLRGPCVFLAEKLYSWRRHRLSITITATATATAAPTSQRGGDEEEKDDDLVSVVCISDTHNRQCPLPDGDVLIHAGDLTQSGSLAELQAAVAWLRAQPHRTKIVVAGNHELVLDDEKDRDHHHHHQHDEQRDDDNLVRRRHHERANNNKAKIDWGDITYLQDSSTTIICGGGDDDDGRPRRHLKVYGSPRSPRNGNWAFQYARGDGARVWDGAVPDDTAILVTHGPPRGHLDQPLPGEGRHDGCEHLLREVWRLVRRPALRLHVFGHVHAGHGHEWARFDALQRAYERTVVAGGGVGNLGRVAWAFAADSLFRRRSSPAEAGCCQMVNAAMVGGLRDEIRRRPIKVYI